MRYISDRCFTRLADPDEAVRDFMQRIHHYEKVYETVTEDDMCYMKYIDVGRQVRRAFLEVSLLFI